MNPLAIFGGEPTVTCKVPLKWPLYLPDEIAEAAKLLEHGVVSGREASEFLKEFEDELAVFFGMQFALLVNSGTSALFSALIGLGIGPNDQVLCPAFSYPATMTPVILLGASAVVCDIEKETWNLCPQDAEKSALVPEFTRR